MEPFQGTTRYEVVRALGQGANGVVYEVIDREQGDRRVALKILRRRDAEALMRLKREFRALADVRHPNLVSLYELVAEDPHWFFTLELIDGVDFLTWLRPSTTPQNELPTAELARTVRREAPARVNVDLPRLREGFRQLAQAVAHLHAQGLQHRDLKPGNVLVTREGRVVVLDFGLVTGAQVHESITEAEGRAIVGTAGYMAPEQAESGRVSAAADWYAFGVMLFEALTGRLPFEGNALAVMVDKRLRPAPAPRELSPSVPEDLDALCVSLLRRNESERAGAREVLAAFGAVRPAVSPWRDTGFVGRERELAALREALGQVRGKGPRMVRVLGGSGIGKSALIRRFLEEVEAKGAVVLAGRCYEREAVPFKALDSVVDALARHLAALAPEKVDAVLPHDAHALVRMFPVLGRVDAFLRAPPREVSEAAELRRRAVRALRELLTRMADRSPVVLVIDDAQWGDADSAFVLDELLRPPDAPELLVVIAARVEDTPLRVASLTPVDLPLSPLGLEDAARLARHAVRDDARAQAIARESGGNPFLLQQLAEVPAERDVTLEDVVRSRLDALPRPARAVLEVVALAASPVPAPVAAATAGLSAADADVVEQLKAERLVRASGDGRLEAWHDRIRETVARGVDSERARDVHARLAVQLRGLPDADIDAIAWHLTVAGLVEEAARATVEAAEKAVAQLAFERAAVLYRRALELLPGDDLRRRDLTVALGDALSDAGRGQAAAEAYSQALEQDAARQTPQGDRLELQRRAAEQLLRSGHIDEGLAASREVLEQVGLSLAKTPRRALLTLAWRRLVLKLRGLGFQERSAAEVPVEALRRIDVCWSISMGLAMVDTIRGASFQSKQLILALDAGEPFRVARALAAEAAFVATGGISAERRARTLVEQARALARRLGDPQLLGLVDFCDGLTRFLVGRWREAAELTHKAERTFTDQGYAVTWEAANSRLFSVWSLFYAGDIAGLSGRLPLLVREAERRGDRYAVTSLQSGLANVSLLAADAPEDARAAVRRVMAEWGSKQFHFQHYWALLSEAMIDLYVGRAADSVARVEAGWGELKSAMLLQIQNVRVEARYLRARLQVATGRTAEALAHAEAMEAEGVEYGRAFAQAIRGVVAGAGGAAQLKAAIDRFSAQDMHAFAAAARVRLGEAQGGDVGAANRRAGLGWLTAQGVRNPEAFARMLLPRAR